MERGKTTQPAIPGPLKSMLANYTNNTGREWGWGTQEDSSSFIRMVAGCLSFDHSDLREGYEVFLAVRN